MPSHLARSTFWGKFLLALADQSSCSSHLRSWDWGLHCYTQLWIGFKSTVCHYYLWAQYCLPILKKLLILNNWDLCTGEYRVKSHSTYPRLKVHPSLSLEIHQSLSSKSHHVLGLASSSELEIPPILTLGSSTPAQETLFSTQYFDTPHPGRGSAYPVSFPINSSRFAMWCAIVVFFGSELPGYVYPQSGNISTECSPQSRNSFGSEL